MQMPAVTAPRDADTDAIFFSVHGAAYVRNVSTAHTQLALIFPDILQQFTQNHATSPRPDNTTHLRPIRSRCDAGT